MRRIIVTSFVVLGVGCTAHENPEVSTSAPPVHRAAPEPPPPDPEPPEPVPIDVAVSSAQILEDCPDAVAKPAVAPSGESQHGRRAMPPPQREAVQGDVAKGESSAVFPAPCVQSWLQLAFTSRASGPVKVAITRARLVSAGSDGPSIPLQTRAPSVWDSTDGYVPWDELVPQGDSKASYKLGARDWSDVANTADGGGIYEVEVEVEVGGERRTLRSPAFARGAPHDIVT